MSKNILYPKWYKSQQTILLFQVFEALKPRFSQVNEIDSKLVEIITTSIVSSKFLSIESNARFSVKKAPQKPLVLETVLHGLERNQRKQILNHLLEKSTKYGHFWAFSLPSFRLVIFIYFLQLFVYKIYVFTFV